MFSKNIKGSYSQLEVSCVKF